jgi:LuxR family maltose regulon positive regulatory protein
MTGTSREWDDVGHAWSDNSAQIIFYGQSSSDDESPQPRFVVRQLRDQLVRAWRCMVESRILESLALAATIESHLHELKSVSADMYRTQIHLIRALGKALMDDSEGVLLELSEVPVDPASTHVRRVLMRFAQWRLSRWSELYLLPVGGPAATSCDAFARIFDRVILAAAALERLQLITASRFAADAMNMAEAAGLSGSIAAASAAAVLAGVRYELGYLEHAEQLVLSRLPIIREQGMPDVVIRVYTLLSRIAQHRGQREHAAVVLNEGRSLGERKTCTRVVMVMMAERVRLLLAGADVSRARQEVSAMRQYAQTHPCPPHVRDENEMLTSHAHVRVLAAEGHTCDAIARMRAIADVAITAQRRYTAFRLTLELAGMLNADAQVDTASDLLVRALKTGERAGLLQCWIDASPACRSLIEQTAQGLAHASSPHLAALEGYIRTIAAHQAARASSNQAAHRGPSCVNARLSTRERAVLVLIAKGHSNKRAAQTLRVTPETIKSHLKRVFVKLGARTRAEAVSRAADMGQLIGVLVPTVTKGEHFWS